MRKLAILIAIPVLLSGLVSFTDRIQEEVILDRQNKSACLSNMSRASTADACSGCHGGSSVGGSGGYVVIIYAGGKLTTDVNLVEGDNIIYVYGDESNSLEEFMSEIKNTDRGLVVSTYENSIDKDKFTSVHGTDHLSVLPQLTQIHIQSTEDQVISINKPSVVKDFNVVFDNSNIQLQLTSSSDDILQVGLFDLAGKSYLTSNVAQVSAGSNMLIFESANPITRGIYIVKLSDSAGKMTTKKIFVD